MSNAVSEMVSEAVKSIKGLIDVNTVVGEPMSVGDGTIVIPISRVSFGFGGGGSEFAPKKEGNEPMFGGGIGGGASVKAEAFMVVSNGNVRIIPITDSQSAMDKLVDMIPGAIDKINGLIANRKKNTGEDK